MLITAVGDPISHSQINKYMCTFFFAILDIIYAMHIVFFLSIHKIVWYLMAIDKSIENYTSNWFTTPEMILSGNSEQMLAAPQICVIVCYRIQSLNISIYFVFYYWAFRLYERSILFNKIRLCIPMNINFLPMVLRWWAVSMVSSQSWLLWLCYWSPSFILIIHSIPNARIHISGSIDWDREAGGMRSTERRTTYLKASKWYL